MSDIVWEDPPPRTGRGRHGAVKAFLLELAAHPGKWALYPSTGSHSYIKGRAAVMGLYIEAHHIGQGTENERLYVRVVEP